MKKFHFLLSPCTKKNQTTTTTKKKPEKILLETFLKPFFPPWTVITTGSKIKYLYFQFHLILFLCHDTSL